MSFSANPTPAIEPIRIRITEADADGYPIDIDGLAGQFDGKAIPIHVNDQVKNLANRLEALLKKVPFGLSEDEVREITEYMKETGHGLFQCLDQDNGQMRLTLQRSLLVSESVRIQMRIKDAEVRSWPWELLYADANAIGNGDGASPFLVLSPKIALSHYFEEAREVPLLEQVDVLRVLVVVSSPRDRGSVEHVAQGDDALGLLGVTERQRARLDLRVLHRATQERLRLAIAQMGDPVHVVHFIGHGHIASSETGKPEATGVILETEDGLSEYVEASTFVRLLGIPEHPTQTPYPRLVIMYTCDSARMDLASITDALIHNGVPAVIGMRFQVTSSFVMTFNEGLYSYLIDGIRVDEAIAECRRNTSSQDTRDVEWCIPVLYLRTNDGRLFAFNSSSTERFRWTGKLKLLRALATSHAPAAVAALIKIGASAIALTVAAMLTYPLAATRAMAARVLRSLPRPPDVQDRIIRLVGPAIEREPEVVVRREMVRLLIHPRISPAAEPFLRTLLDNSDEEIQESARVGLAVLQLVRQGRGEAETYALLSRVFLSQFNDYLSQRFENIQKQVDDVARRIRVLSDILNDGLRQQSDYSSYLNQVAITREIAAAVRDDIIRLKSTAIGMTNAQMQSAVIPEISQSIEKANSVIQSTDHAAQSVTLLATQLIEILGEVADALGSEVDMMKGIEDATRALHDMSISNGSIRIRIVRSDLDDSNPDTL